MARSETPEAKLPSAKVSFSLRIAAIVLRTIFICALLEMCIRDSRIVIAKPVTTTSVPSRGKIDGAGLIRPSVAPSALGGPAKTFAGINGTTLRPKR